MAQVVVKFGPDSVSRSYRTLSDVANDADLRRLLNIPSGATFVVAGVGRTGEILRNGDTINVTNAPSEKQG